MIAAGGLGALGLAGAGLVPQQLLDPPMNAPRPGRGDFRLADAAAWTGLVGSTFMAAGGTATALTLVAVAPLASTGKRPGTVARRDAFALLFEAAGAQAPEGDPTWWVAHRAVAPLPIHFSSATSDGDRLRLLAVFN